jgi:hypothetical protein
MQQLDYWFNKYPNGFYKFLSPCENKHYKTGDSWCEELNFSKDEFRTAFDQIGIRYASKKTYESASNSFVDSSSAEKYYCSYTDKIKGLTYYFRNSKIVDEELEALCSKPISVNRECQSPEVENANLRRLGMPISVNQECQSPEIGNANLDSYTEITPETTSPPTPPEGEPEEREKASGFQILEQEVKLQSSSSLKENSTAASENQDSSKRSLAPVVCENNSQISKNEPLYKKRPKPNEVQWDWVPAGAWKTEEGKLDDAFVMAIASKWAREYGGTSQDKKPNVIKHFRNEPTNLPIEWEWYQDNFFHKVANIQTRKANGLDTAADEAAAIKHIRAATPLDDSQRVTEAHKPSEVVQEVAPYAIPVVEAIAGVKNSIVKGAAIDAIVHQVMSDESEDSAIAPEEAENKAAYQTTVNEEDREFWRQKHQQRMGMIESQPCNRTGSEQRLAGVPPVVATANPQGDELQKAKQFIESLKKRIPQSKSKLTALSEVISSVDNHAVILEDMRKRLNGTDEMRQEAINWACEPANGCQLVRDAKGRVIDIEEMDF